MKAAVYEPLVSAKDPGKAIVFVKSVPRERRMRNRLAADWLSETMSRPALQGQQ
jgi:hypothetical protein